MNREYLIDKMAIKYPDFVFQEYKDVIQWKINPIECNSFDLYIKVYNFGKESVQVAFFAKLKENKDGNYFWHFPFTPYAASGIEEGNNDCSVFIFENLELFYLKKNRIVQKKGYLFQSFSFQYFQEENWVELYKHYVFRYGNFNCPAILLKQKIYY